ncbi:hypothetical protein BDR06DRAFT_71176 [Suillus hirtellus]|nr:hypothetical protein BDR06DRAFT_71176 [Suillus hirtellus]
MTIISNDPSWWPLINSHLIFNYFIVAASVGVIYDWILAFGKEVELIWQHLSFMTVLYLAVRYAGITYAIMNIQMAVQIIPLKDAVSLYMYFVLYWTTWVLTATLGVIMIARLYAMYQRSRKVLVLLVVVFTAIIVANIVMLTINMRYISAEQVILFGTYQCVVENSKNLGNIPTLLIGVWEIFTLCLAVRITLKHFRELGRRSAGGVIRGCLTVLMKTHLSYFVGFVVVFCFSLNCFWPTMAKDQYSPTNPTYFGVFEISFIAQSAVLGPRLILSIREYHAELVTDSDAESSMVSTASQDYAHVLTSISV